MVKKSYDLYGIKCKYIEEGKLIIEKTLEIKMKAHESSYHCGEYFRFGDAGDEHFILQNNYDLFDGKWTEKDFEKYPIILYVNETERSNNLNHLLKVEENVVFLRHQEL